ncbi:CDP-glycerol glycerophosphotransferase family protein [Paucisalibacillus sp. EB02]|uniref:CDP-glycerol glycerophosphotransferase family protein n=1 Tax=Paucisalibacillus sp. EB02 TaxID=1347087 RepID=UPI0004B5DBEB|nr:CDP-glycerol glycerophosphotransferase family protein [Paucisalibacillus sp. EB02]
MVREILITFYLFVFHMLFTMAKFFPIQKKTVCVASFGDNIFYTTRALRKLSEEKIVILKGRSCKYPFNNSTGIVISFTLHHPISYLRSIYHLATATTVLVDNYYGFLAVTNFKEETTCIQLWHANGAIKYFGLQDPSTEKRGIKAKKRFMRVYSRFNYIIVGSERMASIFRKSFEIPDETILRIGIPRTDIFYDPYEKLVIQQQLRKIQSVNGKKVILYAPTFRDHELENYNIQLDLSLLEEHLSSEYVLWLKVHPAVSYNLAEFHSDFVIDVSDYHDVNHLLFNTDILITDYSSIPFEYALLGKPILFFAYDLVEYRSIRGLMNDYEISMPGPIIQTNEEIIAAIKENKFSRSIIKSFANDWNEYSKGNSSMNLAKFITQTDKQTDAIKIS